LALCVAAGVSACGHTQALMPLNSELLTLEAENANCPFMLSKVKADTKGRALYGWSTNHYSSLQTSSSSSYGGGVTVTTTRTYTSSFQTPASAATQIQAEVQATDKWIQIETTKLDAFDSRGAGPGGVEIRNLVIEATAHK
jgi:malate synthase